MIVHNSVVRGAISTADSFESFTTSITDPRNIDNDFSLLTRERIDLFRLAEGDVDFLPKDERIRDSLPFAWSDDSNEDGSAASNSSGGSSLGGVSTGGNYPPSHLRAPTKGLAAQAAAVPLPPASPDELEQLLGFFIDTSDAESVQNAVDLPGLVIDDNEEELNEIYSVDMNSVGAIKPGLDTPEQWCDWMLQLHCIARGQALAGGPPRHRLARDLLKDQYLRDFNAIAQQLGPELIMNLLHCLHWMSAIIFPA